MLYNPSFRLRCLKTKPALRKLEELVQPRNKLTTDTFSTASPAPWVRHSTPAAAHDLDLPYPGCQSRPSPAGAAPPSRSCPSRSLAGTGKAQNPLRRQSGSRARDRTFLSRPHRCQRLVPCSCALTASL